MHIFSYIFARVTYNGDSLYNATSVLVTGNEKLSLALRALTSAELYLNANYYSSHPTFTNLLATETKSSLLDIFFSVEDTFQATVLLQAKSNSYVDWVKQEALKNCQTHRWSPFLSVMALSSVLALEIKSFYSKTGSGAHAKSYHKVYNSVATTRSPTGTIGDQIFLLWQRLENQENVSGTKSFTPNHVLPLFPKCRSQSLPSVQKKTMARKRPCLSSPQHGTQYRIAFPVVAKDNDISAKRIRLDSCLGHSTSVPPSTDAQKATSSSNVACPADHSSTSPYDIGHFVECTENLTDPQIYDILTNIWIPDSNFLFPIHKIYNKKRKFNLSWLQRYSWLAYSKVLDGAFCIPCVFFGRRVGLNSAKLQNLMTKPLNNWNSATQKLDSHELRSEIHKTSLLTMQSFLSIMNNEVMPINKMQDKIIQKQISKNRELLSSVIKTILLCGRHNIPLRGHRDDSRYYETTDSGNFQALLDFRVDSGDAVLKDHFNNSARNATYRSKSIQNEIISCCADVVIEKIIKDIKEAKFYSILADEVRDCSNKEQMPLILRYVSKSGEIQERFLKFIHCDSGLSGEALKDKIIYCITQELNLKLEDCRGQCYDGAGNMAGKFSGLSSRILSLNPLALYTHCSSHRLNLTVAASCQIQIVRNMMDHVTSISSFFSNSPKRQLLLEDMVKKFTPHSKHTKLLDVCKTRWVLRIDGLDRLLEMHSAVAETMFLIRDNDDGSWSTSASEADSLSSIITSFDFIITLVVVRMCLGYTKSATIQLQGAHIDIIKGLQEISMMKMSLQTARTEIDVYHHKWFQYAVDLASKVGAAVFSPRICRRQIHRDNIPAEDVSSYFKRNLSISFLDHLLQELTTRFSEINCTAYKALSIVPAAMITEYSSGSNNSLNKSNSISSSTKTAVTSILEADVEPGIAKQPKVSQVKIQRLDKNWKEDLSIFCEQYIEDMPNIQSISHEVDNWESFWLLHPREQLPSSLADTIKRTNPITFPNLSVVLRILATLPITSCTCERSASSIRILKTYLRSTMTQERLNGLATLFTHKDIEVSINHVINLFARHSRRISLSNILCSDQQLDENDELLCSEMY